MVEWRGRVVPQWRWALRHNSVKIIARGEAMARGKACEGEAAGLRAELK